MELTTPTQAQKAGTGIKSQQKKTKARLIRAFVSYFNMFRLLFV